MHMYFKGSRIVYCNTNERLSPSNANKSPAFVHVAPTSYLSQHSSAVWRASLRRWTLNTVMNRLY